MSKKQRGHFCRICHQRKSNEKFSGRGHAAHICKACAKRGNKPPEIKDEPLVFVDENYIEADGFIHGDWDYIYNDYLLIKDEAPVVTNTGTAPTGVLTATLSGANPSAFQLNSAPEGTNQATFSSIQVDETGNFTVRPRTGLEAGTYTATITLSGNNGISQSFNVNFTVTAPTSTIDALRRELAALIQYAETLLADTLESVDGLDIPAGRHWAHHTAHQEFQETINNAQVVYDESLLFLP
ncbi:MAG: hypothetical protein FWF79_07745 [Defluviitaleaceae bacterium]|nr:hypothetical protein [Defluviitaleaceae bacterium]